MSLTPVMAQLVARAFREPAVPSARIPILPPVPAIESLPRSKHLDECQCGNWLRLVLRPETVEGVQIQTKEHSNSCPDRSRTAGIDRRAVPVCPSRREIVVQGESRINQRGKAQAHLSHYRKTALSSDR